MAVEVEWPGARVVLGEERRLGALLELLAARRAALHVLERDESPGFDSPHGHARVTVSERVGKMWNPLSRFRGASAPPLLTNQQTHRHRDMAVSSAFRFCVWWCRVVVVVVVVR